MIWRSFEDRIKEFVREKMEDGAHGFDHVIRVVRLCELIGKEEGADLDILIPAAYLHDVARPLEKLGKDHAVEGARIAGDFLKDLGYPEDKIPDIVHAIRAHRFKSSEMPKTIEAVILKDADMLDAIGAVGIYRVISHSCESDRGIEETIKHFEEKILKIPKVISTKTARKLAIDRVKLVEEFVKKLKEEIKLP